MDGGQQDRVMVNGRFHLPTPNAPTVEIHRGMNIMTRSGVKAGFSAGVIVRQGEDIAAFILLGRLPVTAEYRQIPINLVDRIEKETIHLKVNCDEILQLPLHQPG